MTTNFSTSAKKAALVAIAATTFSLFSLNASASEVTGAPKMSVDYSDLDLSYSKDTERLYRRLRAASQQVCGIWNKASAFGTIRRNECSDQALTNAVEAVGHASLTALHARKSDVKLAQGTNSDSARS